MWFRLHLWFEIESTADENQIYVKIFLFKCVYFGQPVSENSVFRLLMYIRSVFGKFWKNSNFGISLGDSFQKPTDSLLYTLNF